MKQVYIGHVQYFATGEGKTDIFASGTIEEIANFAGSFYARGLTIFSFDDIHLALQELAQNEDCIDDQDRQDYPTLLSAYIIQHHAPKIATTIKDGFGYFSFFYKLHVNLS
jgi:hypothetical protein